jgi:hypothetical protein
VADYVEDGFGAWDELLFACEMVRAKADTTSRLRIQRNRGPERFILNRRDRSVARTEQQNLDSRGERLINPGDLTFVPDERRRIFWPWLYMLFQFCRGFTDHTTARIKPPQNHTFRHSPRLPPWRG